MAGLRQIRTSQRTAAILIRWPAGKSQEQIREIEMEFVGTWHIYEMEMWDEGYFNMEVQAYIEINGKGLGNFQFGLVSGYLDGEVAEYDNEKRFEFTWEGQDENDPVSGSGWLRAGEENSLEGKIKLHLGDSSKFRARRPG
jgi:hypothetical protein